MPEVPDPLFTRVARALAAEYELIRMLGRGGMATVFLARELALKRFVAVKVLDPELGASPVFRARFQREAETAAQLQHSNIVPIFRVGVADGVAYYVMGYVEGESLAERLQRDHRLPLADALRVAREVADALAAAHRRGIVHRDVKPQNILIERESGRALVTDFGIAGLAQSVAEADADRLTAMGLVMGTPRYMSPEQAAGERDLTGATDLYSLGVVWYEMLTGAYPYRISGNAGPMAMPFSHPMVPLRERGQEIPEPLAVLVDSLLAADPAARPTSGEAVVRAIDAESATGAVASRRARRPLSRRVKWLASGATLFAVGLPLFLFFVRPGAAPRGVDPRKSLLIGFFENTTRDAAIEWLRVGGVELLSQSLKRWTDLQVVDVERLLDLARRVGVEREAAVSRDDAVRMARAAGVWTATVGSLMRLGDRVRITVRVYDVATRRQLTQAIVEAPPDSTLPAAFSSLADQILDVAGAQRSALRDVEPPTRSLAAYQAYVEGIAARSRWDLAQAQSSFQRAVRADSAFALAYYELSSASVVSEFLSQGAQFAQYADSAKRYSTDRPPKERMLIDGYHAWVHSDFPRARDLARQLLALDSTITDAWALLGDASWLDFNIVKDARGRDSLRSSFSAALRSYERALALDESDHRLFASIAQCLSGASLGGERAQLPGFRDAFAGPVNRFVFRIPDRVYTPIYQGDTIALVPAESVALRYPGKVLDSLRAAARRRMNGVMDRWLAVAPREGQAHFLQGMLRQAGKQYDSAEASLSRAQQLGVTTSIPLEYIKLSWHLEARRMPQAVAFVDSLAQAGVLDSLLKIAPIAGGAFVNAEMIGGRLERAKEHIDLLLDAVRAMRMTPEQERMREINVALIPIVVASNTDRVTPGLLARTEADMERRLAQLSDSTRRAVRPRLGRSMAFAAAMLGDTATVRRWTGTTPTRFNGAAAWAAAVAGDRARAELLLAAGDTVRSPTNEFALARAAELIGNTREAIRHYERLDSLDYSGLGNADTDWLLLVRSLPGRAALYRAQGDTARARDYYQRFVNLWRDADDELRAEVDRALRALGQAPPRREGN